MRQRRLGRTELEVGELAMGGLFLHSKVGAYERARDAVARALELGVNYIDTAPRYQDSEAVLGRILGELDAPCILSTKIDGGEDGHRARDVDALRRQVDGSLERLGRDQIDILLIHEPDRPGQYDWWEDMLAVEGPVLRLIDELKRCGTIRFAGLGGTTTSEMAHLCRSGRFDVVLTAFNYSLLWREAEHELLPAAIANDMGIVIGSPLQQGALAARYPSVVDNDPALYWLSAPRREQFCVLYALCDELGMDLPELALRFVLSNPAVGCVLTGARNREEVEANVAAVERGPLDGAVLERLDSIAAMVPFRPCGEPPGLGGRLANPTLYKGAGALA